ncbi:ankyrin repeat domain-containing protein [Imhoffiella purpurea]|uniref:Ankyrin repeat protein n=1 Tax=Imhoffiella purpurea TaxID=1249627 RepID=W9VGU6_9GAMM|nr:ankyrin repeat domain-containing protein [Imhoffiella purpurea]EXJ15272.1 ankyrin repeat protein [Imhoffiella purpurea]
MRRRQTLVSRLTIVSLLTVFALLACSEPAQPTLSLYRAVHIGDLDQVKRHLYWHTDIDQPDVDGDTPLHVAAQNGKVTIAEHLLSHGANPDVLDASGRTPLEVALRFGKTQVAQTLVEHGARIDPQALLLELVGQGISDRDTFSFLARNGAEIDRADDQGRTSLTLAIQGGYLDTVNRLLIEGADVNQPDGRGRMPLAIALKRSDGKATDRQTIVELLQRNGARSRPESAAAPTLETPETSK